MLAFAAVDGKAPLATGEDDDDEVPGENKHETWERGILLRDGICSVRFGQGEWESLS